MPLILNSSVIGTSFSGTASFATTSGTASFAESTATASLALTASYLSGSVESASFAQTASYFSGSVETASFAYTASYLSGSVETASFAFTASYLSGSVETASFAITASYLSGSAVSASYATTASFAVTASYLSGSAVSASYATTASYALTASYFSGSVATASYALTASYLFGTATGSFSGSFVGNINGTLNGTGSISFLHTGSVGLPQSMTGSLGILGNLSVTGTASFQSVTASSVILNQNTLTVFADSGLGLNTAGYVATDTASLSNSGSLLYDVTAQRWQSTRNFYAPAVSASSTFYIGDGTSNETFRIQASASSLVFEKYNGSSWDRMGEMK